MDYNLLSLDDNLIELEPQQQRQQQPAASLFVIKLDRHTSSLTVAKEEQKNVTLSLESSSSPTLSTSVAPSSPRLSPVLTDSVTWQRPAFLAELQATFTPELVYMAYIPLCRLAGRNRCLLITI